MIKAEYLTLRNDQKVCIDINMNSVGSFTLITGKEVFEIKKDNVVDPNLIRTLAWCSATEGEAGEGRELNLTEVEFGRLMGLPQMTAFVKIFMNQALSSEQKKSGPASRNKTQKSKKPAKS